MAGFQFIVTDNRGQTRRDDRRTIRSQCMKGKNTKSTKKAETNESQNTNPSSVDPPAVPELTGASVVPPEKPRAARKRAARQDRARKEKSMSVSTSGSSSSPSSTQSPPQMYLPELPDDDYETVISPTVAAAVSATSASITSSPPLPAFGRIHHPPAYYHQPHQQQPMVHQALSFRPSPVLRHATLPLSPTATPEPEDPPKRTRLAISPESHVDLTPRERQRYRAQTPDLEEATNQAWQERVVRPQPPVGHDITLWKYPAPIDGAGHEVIHTYFSVAQQVVYPATVFVDFGPSNSEWFEWLFYDEAYLHASLAMYIGVRNVLNGRDHGQTMFKHVSKSLKALQKRIASGGEQAIMDNSTVAVVLSLIVVADMLKDDLSAKSHFDGLCRIVKLRGGLDGFKNNAKMHVKLGRFDLGASLDSGKQSRFISSPVSFDSIQNQMIPQNSLSSLPGAIADPDLTPPPVPVPIHDNRLLTVFEDMSVLAHRVNLVHVNKLPKFKDSEFQDYITSIQYRLLQLQSEMHNVSDECVRLSLLAVLATTYPLPGSRIRYPYLARGLRYTLGAIQPSGGFIGDILADEVSQAWRELLLWSLLIGSLAVFDVAGRSWMHALWRQLKPPRDWPTMLECLQRFVWFRPLHDTIGKRAFFDIWAAADNLDPGYRYSNAAPEGIPSYSHYHTFFEGHYEDETANMDGDRSWPF